jgi:hypothetical protein
MSVIYTYSGAHGDIEFDFSNSEINVDAAYDDLQVQEVYDAAKAAEFSTTGIAFDSICTASGKDALNAALGIYRGIACQLLGYWKLYSKKGSGTFTLWGGCLLPSYYGKVFKPNNNIEEINILEQNSTIVTVSSGSGLSTEEHNRLMSIPATVPSTDTVKGLLFERQNTIAGGKITQYVANGDTTVNVTYDGSGIPESEEIA